MINFAHLLCNNIHRRPQNSIQVMALCSHQHLNRTSTGSAFRRQESLEKYRTSANGVIAKVELQVLPHQNQQWCVFKCLPGFQTHIGDHWSRPKWRSKLDCHSDSLPEVLPRQTLRKLPHIDNVRGKSVLYKVGVDI